MPSEGFVKALNDQVAREFAASHQYVAIAIHYDAQTMPQLASFFYAQALEEREHALMMVQYLLDTDSTVTVPAIDAPKGEFADLKEPVALALEQERSVGREIEGLAQIARDDRDYTSEHFVSWFLKEQVEEVAMMSSLLQVVERSGDYVMGIEEYLSREDLRAGADDPTAPPAAGG